VFPSGTDTFGLVLLEALASGVPVAAFPVAGPVMSSAMLRSPFSTKTCGRRVWPR
jgi:hypothetical protein